MNILDFLILHGHIILLITKQDDISIALTKIVSDTSLLQILNNYYQINFNIIYTQFFLLEEPQKRLLIEGIKTILNNDKYNFTKKL